MAERSTLSRLAGLAEDQWGLLTRRQAQRASVSAATFQRLASQGVLRRVAQGVYLLAGAPPPDLVDLRAAWLQLDPETPAWRRSPEQGVASYRSAAAVYDLGHLPADRHDFTLPVRRQSRRPDVRLHKKRLGKGDVRSVRGLLVTRPSRIAADLLNDLEDPEAVGQVIADALREGHEVPEAFISSLGESAVRYGFRSGDGAAVLRWLLDLIGDPEPGRWAREARAQ
jgi:predicted transcriptional regulator of viral defense system